MIFLLAGMTAGIGILYPALAPFLGLLAGFISGSETSAIAMFTKYHIETSTAVGASSIVVGASNGIGGGLASVLSPAKIQNAAAVIDEIGIEGQVIRYGLVVALLMTWATAIMTMLQAFALTPAIFLIVGVMIAIPIAIGLILYFRNGHDET
jgi:lactate permease